MKICLFSDIHGNGQAFFAAIENILSEKADINVFLGDLCGYYYDQMEIFPHLLKIPNLVSLIGNHDSVFLDIYNGDEKARVNYLNRYGKSIEKLLQSDCQDLIDWLSILPQYKVWEDLSVFCCHGSPWDPVNGYIYPDTPLDQFLELSYSVFILGNTHYPMHRVEGEKVIINPGSLGQPRHGGWTSYAVIDFPSKNVTFREMQYDKNIIFSQIDEAMETNQYLKQILRRSK